MNDNHPPQHEQLSELGVARRERMLGELQSRVTRTARVRRVRSTALAAAALALIASLGAVFTRVAPLPQNRTPVMQGPTQNIPQILEQPAPMIQIVRTQPGTLERYTAPPPGTTVAVRIQRINDAELIAALAQMGRPAGIIRSQGRTWLSAAVTDEELGRSPRRGGAG